MAEKLFEISSTYVFDDEEHQMVVASGVDVDAKAQVILEDCTQECADNIEDRGDIGGCEATVERPTPKRVRFVCRNEFCGLLISCVDAGDRFTAWADELLNPEY